MAKHPPRRRPKSEDSPKPPRHRLAEIQAEIHDVQQQIEQLRQAARVIRDAQDVRAWERQITDLTDRLSGLLWAEAMQRASDHPENIQKARSMTQGAGHTLKDQGRRDVTLRTACGVVVVRVPYFRRNCDRAGRAGGCTRSSCSGGCTTAARRPWPRRSASWWRCSARSRRSSGYWPIAGDRGISRRSARWPIASRCAPGHAAGRGPELERDRRRNCDRARSGRGMYPILLLWGMHDRCTAALASEVSKLVAMLGSFQEVERVLADRGRPRDLKTIRSLADRFAARAGPRSGPGA